VLERRSYLRFRRRTTVAIQGQVKNLDFTTGEGVLVSLTNNTIVGLGGGSWGVEEDALTAVNNGSFPIAPIRQLVASYYAGFILTPNGTVLYWGAMITANSTFLPGSTRSRLSKVKTSATKSVLTAMWNKQRSTGLSLLTKQSGLRFRFGVRDGSTRFQAEETWNDLTEKSVVFNSVGNVVKRPNKEIFEFSFGAKSVRSRLVASCPSPEHKTPQSITNPLPSPSFPQPPNT